MPGDKQVLHTRTYRRDDMLTGFPGAKYAPQKWRIIPEKHHDICDIIRVIEPKALKFCIHKIQAVHQGAYRTVSEASSASQSYQERLAYHSKMVGFEAVGIAVFDFVKSAQCSIAREHEAQSSRQRRSLKERRIAHPDPV